MSIKRLAPLLVFLGLAVFLAIGLTRDPSRLPSELIDRPIPPFSIEALDPTLPPVSEAALQGEITILNVFGSWCVGCTVEHPFLMTVGERDDLQLLGVDWRDTREDANRWLTRWGDPYDLIAFDADSALAIELGVTGAPETYVVDPNGRIRYKYVGPLDDQIWDSNFEPVIDLIKSEWADAAIVRTTS